jgi:high-affinity iron transporter
MNEKEKEAWIKMLAGMLITIREGVEAFLIVGILVGYLTKIHQERFRSLVWLGTGIAIVVSLVLAVVFQLVAVQFEGRSAEIFEVSVSLLAVGVLTWMVLWMQRQSRTVKSALERKVDLAISQNQAFALAGLAFISVLREGLETILFLSALFFTSGKENLLQGAGLGLVAAAGIAYLVFKSTVRLNLRKFFLVTGVLLIFIAAGLVGHSVMGLQELGVLPASSRPVWDTSFLISDEGLAGRLLHAFLGYQAAPTLPQMIAYSAYVLIFTLGFWDAARQKPLAASTREVRDRRVKRGEPV